MRGDAPRGKNKYPTKMWAHSNFGFVRGVNYTRKAAVAEVEAQTGKPWREARQYFEVWKCEVAPVKSRKPRKKHTP